MKNKRQEKILELIDRYSIDTQEELLSYLLAEGFPSTQATVSRDIRALHLIKVAAGDGTYRYVQPAVRGATAPKLASALTDSVVNIDFAGNLVVVKTYPGMANAVAACIDSFSLEEVIGCVAGDDAILVVVRTAEGASVLCGRLREILRRS